MENSGKICEVCFWADPLQNYRAVSGSKKRGKQAFGIMSVPCKFRDTAGTSSVKTSWGSPEGCSSFPEPPWACLQLVLLTEPPLHRPVWPQAFLLLLCWQELLPDLFSLLCLHYMSPQQHPGIVVGIELAQRFKGDEWRKRCLRSLLLKGISVSHPSLLTLSKGRDRIVFLRQEKSKTKPLFLYLLVWRNLLIIVATAAASSAFRWMARQLLQSVFFSKPCFSGVENKPCVFLT